MRGVTFGSVTACDTCTAKGHRHWWYTDEVTGATEADFPTEASAKDHARHMRVCHYRRKVN